MTTVIKRDGSREDLNIDKLHKVVFAACLNCRLGIGYHETFEIENTLQRYTFKNSLQLDLQLQL